MRIKLLILSIAVLCLSAAPAMAHLFDGTATGGDPLQAVLDGITTAPVSGSSSVNVNTDMIPDSGDSFWHIAATGGSTSTMIIELASFAPDNTFGIYDLGNPANTAQIFAGFNTSGDQAILSIDAAGNVKVNFTPVTTISGTWFGYYLDSSMMTVIDDNGTPSDPTDDFPVLVPNPAGGVWYSDSSLNTDSHDHMYAYQGLGIDDVAIPPWAGLWTTGEYALAFEDLNGAVFSDWDYTDMVVMVQSVYVPVPGAILLGILGLSVAGLKLRKYA